MNRLLFLDHNERTYDEIAVIMTAIIKVRNQRFPFLWHDANWNRRDLMDTARGTAAIILLSDTYPTQRALYNAVKRALYHEARSWGWRRERNQPGFTPPLPTLPLDNLDDME